MSQIEKLINKINSRPIPADISFDDVKKLARYYGCDVVTRGNHQWAVVCKKKARVIPIPDHGKFIKKAYVKEIRDLFQAIEEEKQ